MTYGGAAYASVEYAALIQIAGPPIPTGPFPGLVFPSDRPIGKVVESDI
jgi:hypothetical protein